jgi:flagellar hook-associated protein 3 FlgL
VDALNALQGEVQRTQSQVASGNRLLTPADDPVAAGRIQELERWKLASAQQERNADLVMSRLSLQESALTDATDVLQRMQELAVQGGNGSLDETARRMLAAEVRSRSEQLLQVANRRTPSGEYLFGGARIGAEPFVRQDGAVLYGGDDLVRDVEIAPGQRIADGFPGSDLFMRIPAGNGDFALRADGGNTGTGIVGGGALVDPAGWDGANYRVLFMPDGSWEVRDVADALVATAPYDAGSSIEFRGIRLTISGTPAVGDQFHLEPAGSEDIFTTVTRLAEALESPVAGAAQRAAVHNGLNSVLTQLEGSLAHVLNVRSALGTRLTTLDDAAASRAVLDEDVVSNLSKLRDTDYSEALTRLNRQLTGLQAAQQSYAKLARLSLFDYL